MKNKIHSLIVEGLVFCGSGLVLLSYSLSSYAKGFNKSWAQSPYLFPLIVAIAMIGLSLWIVGEGVTAMKKAAANLDDKKPEKAGKTEKRRWVVIALILCAIYYAALAFIKIPYITIGILSFAYTFSTFEVVTVVFLICPAPLPRSLRSGTAVVRRSSCSLILSSVFLPFVFDVASSFFYPLF